MPLPAFNAQGLLPDGVHRATIDELHERCVADFPGSETRPQLFANYLRYRNEFEALGLSITQWIDGSFVDQTRLNPRDIDLVNFCESDMIRGLSADVRQRARSLLNEDPATKREYQIHSFLITKHYDDPYRAAFEKDRRDHRIWFSQPLDYTGTVKEKAPHRGRKGIVEIIVGDVRFCPLIERSI